MQQQCGSMQVQYYLMLLLSYVPRSVSRSLQEPEPRAKMENSRAGAAGAALFGLGALASLVLRHRGRARRHSFDASAAFDLPVQMVAGVASSETQQVFTKVRQKLAAHVESHSLGLLPSAAEPQPTTEPVPGSAQQTTAADPEAASGHRTASQTVSFFRRLLDMVPAADYGLTGEDLDAIKAESAAAEEQRHTEAQESMLMLDAAH